MLMVVIASRMSKYFGFQVRKALMMRGIYRAGFTANLAGSVTLENAISLCF